MKRPPSTSRAFILKLLLVLIAVVMTGLLLLGFAVVRTLTPGQEVRVVRNEIRDLFKTSFQSRIEISAKPWMVGLARLGLGFAPIEPRAKTAMGAVRGADVGVYRLNSTPVREEFPTLIDTISGHLEKKDWERVVTVLDREEIVLVFSQMNGSDPTDVQVLTVVLNGEELVIVSGRGNLLPLMDLVDEQLKEHLPRPALAPVR